MLFSFAGRRKKDQAAEAPQEVRPPLAVVRVSRGSPRLERDLGRRNLPFTFDRIFIPSLILDQTELALRQAGVCGQEGFAVWAGTLANADAYISSVVIPRASSGPGHGEISKETTAHVLEALDGRDLVPILQLHTHPTTAWLSQTDAIRPLVSVAGFVSVIVPDFGFVDLADVGLWSAHEFMGQRGWRELDSDERRRRFLVEDAVIRVD